MTSYLSARPLLPIVWLLISLLLPVPLLASEKFQVTLSGSLRTVDPALQGTFHVGDPFEFGFLLDTANFTGSSEFGTGYMLKGNYFRIGHYRATSPDTMTGRFISRALEGGRTEQGFQIERHDMIAPAINGMVLSDTYIKIGFDEPLGAPVFGRTQLIGPAELLSINDRSIVLQESVLEYAVSPYKIVRLDINSMTVVPEPAFPSLALLTATLLSRQRRVKINR